MELGKSQPSTSCIFQSLHTITVSTLSAFSAKVFSPQTAGGGGQLCSILCYNGGAKRHQGLFTIYQPCWGSHFNQRCTDLTLKFTKLKNLSFFDIICKPTYGGKASTLETLHKKDQSKYTLKPSCLCLLI